MDGAGQKVLALPANPRRVVARFQEGLGNDYLGIFDMVLFQHSGKILDIQFPVRLSTELQGRYPFLKVIDIVIQIVDKGLRVDAFPVFPQPQMEVWPRRFSCISRDRHDVACFYNIMLFNDDDAQMSIQALDTSMLENDIVPVASIATMNLLDDTCIMA